MPAAKHVAGRQAHQLSIQHPTIETDSISGNDAAFKLKARFRSLSRLRDDIWVR